MIEVFLYNGFLHSAHAVESPKHPLPTIRIEEGISEGVEGDIAGVQCSRRDIKEQDIEI